jgi:hypothetical protein
LDSKGEGSGSEMNKGDWKVILSVWIVCGIVGVIVLVIFATMLGILAFAYDMLNRESERIPRRFCLTAVLRGLRG